MATPPSLTQIAFAGGINESQREEIVDPASAFTTLENVRQVHPGSVEKRKGFDSLSLSRLDATSRSAGYKLFTDDNVICVSDGTELDVYDSVNSVWVNRGRLPEAAASLLPMPSAGMDTSVEDVEYCNGYFAITYRILTISGLTTSCFTFVALVNATTGAVIRPPEQLNAVASIAGGAFVASYSNRYFVAFSTDEDNGGFGSATVDAWYLDTSTAATINAGWQAMTQITNDYDYGFVACSMSDRIAVAYATLSGTTNRITVKTLNISGAIQTTTVNTSSVLPDAIDIVGSTIDTLWVGFALSNTTLKIIGLNPTTISSITSTAATIITSTAPIASVQLAMSSTAGHGRAWVDTTGAEADMRGFQTTAGATATEGAQKTLYNVHMGSRPVCYGGRYYGCFFSKADVSTLQRNCILGDWTDVVPFVRPVAHVAPGLAVFPTYRKGKLLHGSSATKFYTPITVVKSAVGNAAYLAEFDFAASRRWQAVTHNGTTYLSGGMLSYFDGNRTAEVNFLSKPTKPTTTTSGSGITGNFRYVAVYEEVDGDGNWTVSGISDPSAVATVTNVTITVSTLPLYISSRLSSAGDQASGVRVAFYRTLTGSVPPYYRVGTATNTTSAGTVTFGDAVSDATLATQPKLYSPNLPGTAGAAQDRRPPPNADILDSFNGMLLVATGSDLWYSGQPVSGEAVWFNPLFQIPVPGAGDITALTHNDGTEFIFKRDSIYAVTGEPPSDNGASGGLGIPRKLAVDVGCIDNRSILTTTFGTFFQSARGLELLTRAQSVEWIGENVQDTVAAFPVCVSATLDAENNLAYFEMAAAETLNQVSGGGRTLVYDLVLKIWLSTDRRKNQAGTADTAAQSACMVWNGTAYRYAWLGTEGRVYVESDDNLDPGDTWVTMKAETGWFKTAGIQGYQAMNRALVLADYATPHNLALAVAYNYEDYETPRTFTNAELVAVDTALSREQVETIFHPKAEGEAIRIKLTDATPTTGTIGTGEGSTWIAITIEGTARQGAARLPAISR